MPLQSAQRMIILFETVAQFQVDLQMKSIFY